mgnify:FL=1
MDSAKRVISGTWGEVWIDGELVAECTACQGKYTYNKETVPMCGQMVNDKKVVSVDATGSITLNKVYSRMQEKSDMILQGHDVRSTIITNLADPDAYGAERVAFYNVSWDDQTLADWAQGKLGTTTHPFTFTRHKYLDKIDPE